MLEGLESTPLKERVRIICSQTCLSRVQVQQLLRVIELQKQLDMNCWVTNKPQPTILVESLRAPDPVALATQAIEHDWTAERVRADHG